MIKVAVVGACGRMGREVCRELVRQGDMEVIGGVEVCGHPSVGSPLGTGYIVSDLSALLPTADVVVDFSRAGAVAAHAQACAESKTPYVVGVTGLSEIDIQAIRFCALAVPVVHAVNFSVGIAILRRLVSEATRLLGPGYDIDILEIHHHHKLDTPSGTAKMLAASIQEASQGNRSVSVNSLRTGGVVGEHRVIFGGPGERVEFVHKAESRLAFVTGVIAAVRFVQHSRQPGLYSIDDLLG